MKLTTLFFTGLSLAGIALADQQPAISIPVVNNPCNDGPKMVAGKPDTVASQVDDSGFVSIFNGKDMTGWWEDCQTGHTTHKDVGAVWLVDPSQKSIYSQETAGGDGGILVTNKVYGNYEIVLDLWPTFGDDGGIFNRMTYQGTAWQSVIDYIQGSGVGGSYNERGWRQGNLNDDPFRFNANPASPFLVAWDETETPKVNVTWTSFTKDMNPGPTSFGCSAGGCVETDFAKIWDLAGWNQMRVKFYDGLVAGRSVTMETFLRKAGASAWTPIYKSTKAVVTPAGPIGLQIHGGGRWKTGAWNMYRNIKIRNLNIDGTVAPFTSTTAVKAANPDLKAAANTTPPNLEISQNALVGTLDLASDITIRDVAGHVVDKFHADSGNFQHALATKAQGILFVEFKNNRGVSQIRLNRI